MAIGQGIVWILPLDSSVAAKRLARSGWVPEQEIDWIGSITQLSLGRMEIIR
jgi:hypothetical protein